MFIKETEPFLAPFCFYKVANSGNIIKLSDFQEAFVKIITNYNEFQGKVCYYE